MPNRRCKRGYNVDLLVVKRNLWLQA